MAPTLRLAGVAAGEFADSFVLRRARKAHRCARKTRWIGQGRERRLEVLGRHWDGGPIPAECTGEIQAGEQYVEYIADAMPCQAGSRYCAECAVAAGLTEFADGGPLATAGVEAEAGTTTPESRTAAPPFPPVVGGHLGSLSMGPTVCSGQLAVTQLAHPMVAGMHT